MPDPSMGQLGGSLIHIYNAPPQAGDEALCGHVKAEEETYRLHRSDNQCEICNAIAEAEGRSLVSRPPHIEDPRIWVREPPKENP